MSTSLQHSAPSRGLTLFKRSIVKLILVVAGMVLLSLLDGSILSPAMKVTPDSNLATSLSIAGLCLVYVILMLTQPRLLLWSRWRFLYIYLLTIFTLTFMSGFFASPLLRILGYVVVCGVVVQARLAMGRRELWVLVGVVSLAILLDLFLIQGLGLSTIPDLSVMQMGLWLAGLAFIHSLTGLGTQERTARLHNEKLVRELTAAQKQLRLYAAHVEELAIMRERARVAREMHDTLAQGLSAIKMHLETGCTIFARQPDVAYQHMASARALAGEHLQEARKTILELRCDALEGQSLPGALATLAANWQASEGTATCYISPELEGMSLPPPVVLACYRIAQEALHNAVHHGQARHVALELSVEAGDLCLTITDDGSGFDPAELNISDPETTRGFGLIGMQERTALLNGRLEIASAAGVGTQVAAMLPLPVFAPGHVTR